MEVNLTLRQHYQTSVMNALGGYQLLEEALKTYLGIYYDAIRTILAGRLHCGFSLEDFSNLPLGKLCNAFAKTSTNDALANEIRALIAHRNHMAHQSLSYMYDLSVQDSQLVQAVNNNLEMTKRVSDILGRVHASSVEVHQTMEGVVAAHLALVASTPEP